MCVVTDLLIRPRPSSCSKLSHTTVLLAFEGLVSSTFTVACVEILLPCTLIDQYKKGWGKRRFKIEFTTRNEFSSPCLEERRLRVIAARVDTKKLFLHHNKSNTTIATGVLITNLPKERKTRITIQTMLSQASRRVFPTLSRRSNVVINVNRRSMMTFADQSKLRVCVSIVFGL